MGGALRRDGQALEASLRGVPATVITFLPLVDKLMMRVVLSSGKVDFCSEGLTPVQIDDALAGSVENTFVERLAPPQRLIVLGAGDDARPLVRMAALPGWDVTVVDGRRHLARPERFREAHRVLAVDAKMTSAVGIGAVDAVVVMTHSYEQDRDWIAALLPIAPRYLGVLGARHRSSSLVSAASAMTGLSISECCERIYAPIGLDLGGDGPEAIALAVMAEAQACCMGRLAGSRRLSCSDVLMQVSLGDATRYTEAQCARDPRAD